MMDLSEIELPSDRKFGWLFTVIFAAVAAYFYITAAPGIAHGFAIAGLVFLVVTLARPSLLHPLNRLWMQFGLLLGRIIGPIVMGLIFFGLFTPVSLVTRLFGRDELRLRGNAAARTHWKDRAPSHNGVTRFEDQF